MAKGYFAALIGIIGLAVDITILGQPQKHRSAHDLKSIYKITLTNFLAQEKHILPQCGYPILGKKKVIYLLSDTVNKQALPTLAKFTYHLLNKGEIVKRAGEEDGFCYVSIVFSNIEPKKVQLVISEKMEHKTYQQAGRGSRYECQKDKVRWTCKTTAVVMESR